jgi:serine/threonine protein kinase
MGAVYRARRLHIGDEVAIKLLHEDLLVKPQALERFRREARSAAMISHPNVVSIHDFNDGQPNGTPPYIVMEFVRGNSLHNLLRREGRLSVERTVSLMRDICAGVGVAHRQGVVHRDLKPDNVIVAPGSHEYDRETAKVVDFGIAKLRDMATESGLTQTGAMIGTIYYMSPEQCRGEELDARADVYSLGAMLYEMLTGEPPFRSNNLAGFISKHLAEPPPRFPASLKIPPALAASCYKALAKNREERPADALALGRELENAFGPVETEQKPDIQSKPIVSAEPHKSNWIKWAVGGLAVLLLAFIVAGTLAAYFYSRRFAIDSDTTDPTANIRKEGPIADSERAGQVSGKASSHDLRGTWTGTYGPLGQPARLIIKKQSDKTFTGVLLQGEVEVTFAGTYDSGSGSVTMKQLSVVTGNSWSLGEDAGNLSADGTRMSGTGKDAIGGSFGMSYQWTFSKQ